MYVSVHVHAWCPCGQRAAFGNWFSSSTMWVWKDFIQVVRLGSSKRLCLLSPLASPWDVISVENFCEKYLLVLSWNFLKKFKTDFQQPWNHRFTASVSRTALAAKVVSVFSWFRNCLIRAFQWGYTKLFYVDNLSQMAISSYSKTALYIWFRVHTRKQLVKNLHYICPNLYV